MKNYNLKNRRGLSGIVTTLIIILLVIAAVSVIWGVVSNLLSSGTGSINKNAMCLEIDLSATKVINGSTGVYNVTIERKGGPPQAARAKVMFFNDVGNTKVFTENTDFNILDIATLQIDTSRDGDTLFPSANMVRVIPYFIDEKSGEEIICDQSKEFTFTLAS